MLTSRLKRGSFQRCFSGACARTIAAGSSHSLPGIGNRKLSGPPLGTENRELENWFWFLYLSIVVPAYNESARLGASLEKILSYIAQQKWSAEVIVVNDGSRDDTAGIVRRLAQENSVLRLVENPGNRGKGYSVRNGMLQARGRVVVFSDATSLLRSRNFPNFSKR